MAAPSPDQQYSVEFNKLVSQAYADEGAFKTAIGDYIYGHVVKYSSEENAPKITGMIIDMPAEDIKSSVGSLEGLKEKIQEGEQLLTA